MQGPVKLQQHRGQGLRNSMVCEDLLNGPEMPCADFGAGIFVRGLRERTEDRRHSWRQKYSEWAKALQRCPFETKKIFIESFIAGPAAIEVLFGGLEGIADDRGGDAFLRRKVVEKRSIGD